MNEIITKVVTGGVEFINTTTGEVKFVSNREES